MYNNKKDDAKTAQKSKTAVCALHAHYFLKPLKIPAEISRQRILFHNIQPLIMGVDWPEIGCLIIIFDILHIWYFSISLHRVLTLYGRKNTRPYLFLKFLIIFIIVTKRWSYLWYKYWQSLSNRSVVPNPQWRHLTLCTWLEDNHRHQYHECSCCS